MWKRMRRQKGKKDIYKKYIYIYEMRHYFEIVSYIIINLFIEEIIQKRIKKKKKKLISIYFKKRRSINLKEIYKNFGQ